MGWTQFQNFYKEVINLGLATEMQRALGDCLQAECVPQMSLYVIMYLSDAALQEADGEYRRVVNALL